MVYYNRRRSLIGRYNYDVYPRGWQWRMGQLAKAYKKRQAYRTIRRFLWNTPAVKYRPSGPYVKGLSKRFYYNASRQKMFNKSKK